MLTPTREAFYDYTKQGNLIPVCRRLMADTLTPVLAFERLSGQGGGQAFLLESVTGGEKISRYSFLGVDPVLIFRSSGSEIEIVDRASGTSRRETHPVPLDRLHELIAGYKPVHLPHLPRFAGGLVGYFGYDVVRQVERLPNPPARSLDLPEIYVGLYTSMLIFDHVKMTVTVVAHADCREKKPDAAYADAERRIDDLVARLQAPEKLAISEVPELPAGEPQFSSNFKREDFEKAVESCKEYIRAGDIFQVVLSQRLSMSCSADPLKIYRNVRVINPSPYMFCLRYPELTLVGASPEVMLRVEDGVLTVRPIAGTRPRGKTEAEDSALEADLLADPKELAEHTMLVDLGRNDVGRASEYGSVRLTDQMVVERYSHVMHIVSNVEGKLRQGLTALDALKSCLPAGTLSGAPKVRAMEIIDEFEPDRRGTYGGAVGYVDFGGNLDTCIVIRTILLHQGTAYVQAGAGIVADSVPANEYMETRNKAMALLRALQASEG